MDNKQIYTDLDVLVKELIKELYDRKYYVATAESCTGGMIASSIVNIPGASYVMNESYITYSNEAKMRILRVKEETLEKYGAVSEETAREMVCGVANVSDAECAIAVTGIAGPDGGTEEKPVGTVYAGFYFEGEVVTKRYNFDGSRYEVRLNTTKNVILDMLRIIRKN